MSRLLILLGLLGLLVAPAGGAPAGDYFPLTAGTIWTYRTNVGTDLLMRIGGTGQVGGVACTLVESVSNAMVTQRECFRRQSGAVYAYVRAYPAGNVVLSPPQPMLLLPPKIGRAWTWEGKAGDAPARMQFQWARAETVTVPAGTYAAMQLYLEGAVGAERVQSWRWFAPGVGMVREDSIAAAADGRNLRIVADLKEYRPGK